MFYSNRNSTTDIHARSTKIVKALYYISIWSGFTKLQLDKELPEHFSDNYK